MLARSHGQSPSAPAPECARGRHRRGTPARGTPGRGTPGRGMPERGPPAGGLLGRRVRQRPPGLAGRDRAPFAFVL